MRDGPFALTPITGRIIGCAIKVHKQTGAGLLESVYKACLIVELRAARLNVETECDLPLFYNGAQLEVGYRADMIVERTVVVEVKSVEKLLPVHHAQVVTYLKLTGCRVGLLVNFNVPILRHGIRRIELRETDAGIRP